MDAILAHIDSATSAEMGYLLPELERRKILVADTPLYCHGNRITCFYRFRGQQFLWACAHIGHDQTGRIKVPARAAATAALQTGLIALTRCRRCGDGFALIMETDRSITPHRGPSPTFTEVVD